MLLADRALSAALALLSLKTGVVLGLAVGLVESDFSWRVVPQGVTVRNWSDAEIDDWITRLEELQGFSEAHGDAFCEKVAENAIASLSQDTYKWSIGDVFAGRHNALGQPHVVWIAEDQDPEQIQKTVLHEAEHHAGGGQAAADAVEQCSFLM